MATPFPPLNFNQIGKRCPKKAIRAESCKYSGNKDDFKSLDEPWNTNLFHQKLIEFRKNDPKSFGAMYDTLRTNLTLMQLVSDNLLIDNVTRMLEKNPSDISMSDPVVRLDVPEEVTFWKNGGILPTAFKEA